MRTIMSSQPRRSDSRPLACAPGAASPKQLVCRWVILISCGLVVLLSQIDRSTAQFTPFEQAIADFDADVARGVADDGGGCVMVCVFQHGEVVWSRGYGWADIENQVPATSDTIGRVGSISKSFTAILMVKMVEQGVISLDDAVADYFPELMQLQDRPDGTEPITFRMLASHTSGLEREPRLRDAASGPIEGWEEKVVESVGKTHFANRPLVEYSYSNIGFGILGLATSRAADRPFMELMEDQIFKPLSMHDTTFVVDDQEMMNRLAVGYTRLRDGTISSELPTAEHQGRGYKVPNGGIYSTVGDLAKLTASLTGHSDVQILSDDSLEQLFSPQLVAEHYGLGFSLVSDDAAHLAGHGGSVAGYRADLRFDVNTGLGVAALWTTRYRPETVTLLRELLDAAESQ